MQNQLERILKLVQKTGDRLVVFDKSNPEDDAYVVMNINDYEALIDIDDDYDEDWRDQIVEDAMDDTFSDNDIHDSDIKVQDPEVDFPIITPDHFDDEINDFSGENSDMESENDIPVVNIDNSDNYGKISSLLQKEDDSGGLDRSKWYISANIKQKSSFTDENDKIEENNSDNSEKDRYYLEEIN